MSEAEEVVEIMARAMDPSAFELFEQGGPCKDLDLQACDWARNRARVQIAALHAHGYKITKDDPDMLSIPEVSTDRPIGH